MVKSIFSCITFLFMVLCLSGQETNPFELKYRLDSSDLIPSVPASQDSTDSMDTNRKMTSAPGTDRINPFDITNEPKSQEIIPATKEEKKLEEFFQGKESHFLNPNTAFWILSFITLLLAIIVNLDRSLIRNLLKAWTNANFANFLLRNRKSQDRLLFGLLAVIFYINMALFISQSMFILWDIPVGPVSALFLILGVVTIYLIRHASLHFLAKLFPVEKEAIQYSYTINLFNILIGVFLIVINFLLAYLPPSTGIIFVYMTLAVIGLQYLYRSVRGLLISGSLIAENNIHFFLYLCTCEIAPLLLLFTWIKSLG